jgi:hypothetical protein
MDNLNLNNLNNLVDNLSSLEEGQKRLTTAIYIAAGVGVLSLVAGGAIYLRHQTAKNGLDEGMTTFI